MLSVKIQNKMFLLARSRIVYKLFGQPSKPVISVKQPDILTLDQATQNVKNPFMSISMYLHHVLPWIYFASNKTKFVTGKKYAKLYQRFGACFQTFSEDITFNVQSWRRKNNLENLTLIALLYAITRKSTNQKENIRFMCDTLIKNLPRQF